MRKMIVKALEKHGETWDQFVYVLGAQSQWRDEDDPPVDIDTEFDDGYGGVNSLPFTGWTAKRVYFPAKYDGAEWVESVPRHPSDEPTDHVGGG